MLRKPRRSLGCALLLLTHMDEGDMNGKHRELTSECCLPVSVAILATRAIRRSNQFRRSQLTTDATDTPITAPHAEAGGDNDAATGVQCDAAGSGVLVSPGAARLR